MLIEKTNYFIKLKTGWYEMRRTAILTWCILLFLGTCVKDVRHILTDFQFVMNFHPEWSEFLHKDNYRSTSYIIQKIGHFGGFFVLSALASNLGRYKSGLMFAIGYGIFTELIQPFFNRDGRILDMFIDAAGALLAYIMGSRISRDNHLINGKKSTRN